MILKRKLLTIHAPMHCHFQLFAGVVIPTSSTLMVPGMPAKVTLHCTSALPLVHQVVPAKLTLWTVTADEPMVMESTAADLPPKELAMVAVPADRGRSLLSRAGLPRLAISLAIVVVDVTVMVVEAACTCTGIVGCLYDICCVPWVFEDVDGLFWQWFSQVCCMQSVPGCCRCAG